jgi:putative sterol carrier protein
VASHGQIEQFFEDVGSSGRNPLLERTSGTLLVELTDDGKSESWYVTVHRGDVGVSRTGSDAGCALRAPRSTFLDIVEGKLNPIAGLLRGLIQIEGNVGLLIALQTFLKPSRGAQDQRVAGYAGRRS